MLKRVLKNDLRKAFCSRGMAFSLGIGICIALAHFFQYVFPKYVYDPDISFCPESVYYNWIGASCFPLQTFVYFLILPILAVLPNGASFYEEKESTYMDQVCIRSSKRIYILSNCIATFLSGGFAFTIPLILNFLLTCTRLPMLTPEPIVDIGPSLTCIMPDLYYEKPLFYVCFFLLIDFSFAGGISMISLLASFYAENKFVVLLAPFVVYYSIYCVCSILGGMVCSPNYFLVPGMGDNYLIEFVISFGCLLFGLVLFIWKGVKNEII